MAKFPIASGQVQLSGTAPVGTDAYLSGILRDAGNTVARASTSGGAQYINGIPLTSSGQVVYVDATGGLPANTQFINGIPISPGGAVCVSTAAAATWSNGIPFAANGAISAVFSGGASLRQVASRSYIANVINAGLPTSMSRTTHYTMAAVTALTLTWSNGYVDNATGLSHASGGTMQLTASVEYPSGTFTQVKFSGVASGTSASGVNLTSDSCAVSIPANTQFFVRTWYSNPTVGAMYQADLGNIGIAGEAFNYNGTVADQTMSGTISNLGAASAFAPISIVGLSSKNAYLCIGDSMLAGTGDSYSAQSAEVGLLGRSLWSSRAYAIFGCPGMRANQFAANAPVQQAVGGNFTAVVSEYGSNDLVFPQTSAQLIASQQAIAALYPGKPFYVTTIPPRTTSTDSWATTVNQTPLASEAQRIAYNTALRAGGISGITGFIEIADQVESARNSGFWKVNGTANWGTADGIHPSQNLYLAVAASGVVTATLPA